ncbi:MAG: glycosyltransferase family 4 protein [Prevotella sp.]|nr:glycosyltransferase family 4 protein [Prevotella sp.]
MKIAILTSGFLPLPAVKGGAVENLIDMYLAYNDRHRLHDITVYSVEEPDAHSHPALASTVNHYRYIDVDSLQARLLKSLHKLIRGKGYYHYTIEYYLKRAIDHIRKQHYDMIVIENRPGYALKLKGRTNAQVVCHLHNDVLSDETPYAKEICANLSGIVTVSDFLSQRVSTITNTSANKLLPTCITVHNGIDLTLFSPQAPTTARRSDYSMKPEDFVLVFSGRVIPEKGIGELIEAMLRLVDYPQIKLLVVGSSFYANNKKDSVFMTSLKEKSTQLGSRLVFTGYVPYDHVPSVLSLADVAVLPSVWNEPLGMTCIEAMAMGLPVITTRQGGIPETVSESCAMLLPADEQLVDSLAQAIIELYHQPEKRKNMHDAALRQAQHFSKETFARHFFNAIEAVSSKD